jgi:large subunit ribosomal protein L4
MQLEVLNIQGNKTGRQVELSDAVFGIEPHEQSVWLAVKAFLANQRQGTHKAKQRNEIAGSTRKLHKQKGTGGSRKGSIKNPLYHGGGRVHGPQPRDYSEKLNKKVKSLARRSVLSVKAQAGQIMVVEDFSLDAPKTQQYLSILSNLNISNKKTLVLLEDVNTNVYLSSRNLENSSVKVASEFNVHEVLKSNCLVISEKALKVITDSLG